jgi:hypothetical protein
MGIVWFWRFMQRWNAAVIEVWQLSQAFLCSAIYCTVGGKKWSQKDSIFFYRIVHINFSSTALAFFGEINKKIPGCFLDIF